MHPFDVAQRRARHAFRVAVAAAVPLACGGADQRGTAHIEDLTTKVAISEFVGGDAERCVFSAPGLELCTWLVEEGDDAWPALADASVSEGNLNLLCELPLDGSPRAEGSCHAHARAAQTAGPGSLPPVGAAGSLEKRREAEKRLGEALTILEISRLIGDAPESCRTGQDVQTCEWNAAEGSAGYALLAALVDDAGSGSAVRLRCVVPLDGAARATDSCGAAWADSDPLASKP